MILLCFKDGSHSTFAQDAQERVRSDSLMCQSAGGPVGRGDSRAAQEVRACQLVMLKQRLDANEQRGIGTPPAQEIAALPGRKIGGLMEKLLDALVRIDGHETSPSAWQLA